MKLLHKTSLYYLLFSIPALITAGIACYYIISSEVKESNDEFLRKRKSQIVNYINACDTATLAVIQASGEANILLVKHKLKKQNIFSDTLILDVRENEFDPYRLLKSNVSTVNGEYIIRVWRSAIEFDELVAGIVKSLFVVLFLLFSLFFIINWRISLKIWKPFYKTLGELRGFRASKNVIPDFENTAVKEFSDMNYSLNAMMQKMILDFNSQKQFTENAAHEMQTPLAIIKSKIDLLIQSDKLGKNENELILSIDDAAAKLSRLNKSLLLLTKIENRQFEIVEDVSLNRIIDDSLTLFEDQIESRNITLTRNFKAQVNLNINPDLCFVFINNILQNAIRHNLQDGLIELFLDEHQLVVSNSGLPVPIDDNVLFNRFQKNTASKESLGLGLAIAKEIADASGLKFIYKYESNKHHFIISFK